MLPFGDLKRRVTEIESALETNTNDHENIKKSIAAINHDTSLKSDVSQLLDELNWKFLVLLRILLVDGTIGPRDVIAVLSVNDEATFRDWIAQHNETLSPDARKYFNDIIQLRDHKDPG